MAISTVKLNGETLMTVDDTTADASEVLSGQYFYAADGTKTQGSIATKTASNLSVSGATVTAPAGYYASAASASVASGTAGTPSASKGAVSNHSVSVTPTVTNTTGYITGGTKTGTAVTVSASELDSGSKSISSNGSNIDVVGYASVNVAVPNTYTATINGNGNHNNCYVSLNGVRYYDHGQTFTFSAGDTITLYADGTNSSGPITINGSQVAYSSTSFATYDYVAIPSDITITLYYSSLAQISVSTTSVAVGSAFTPAVTITVNPAFSLNSSTGVITATAAGSSSITPTVSAGYIVSGTAGTVGVSGTSTYALSTQAAQTLYPSTADQTLASARYLTGTQTFKSVVTTNLLASNIAEGVTIKIGDSSDDDRIAAVTGTFAGGGSVASTTIFPVLGNQTFNASAGAVVGIFRVGYLSSVNNSTGKLYLPRVPRYADFQNGNTYHIKGTFKRIDAGISYSIDADFTYNNGATVYWTEDGTQNTVPMVISSYAAGTVGGIFTVESAVNDTKDVWADFVITDGASIDGFSEVDINFMDSPLKSIFDRTYSGVLSYDSYFGSQPGALTNKIGSYAFAGCTQITQVYFDNVRFVGQNAFQDCTGLTSAHFSSAETLGGYAFSYCVRLESVYAPQVYKLEQNCFMSCSRLQFISLPAITVGLPQGAFSGCSSLVSVYMPSVPYVGTFAFCGCQKLEAFDCQNVSVISQVAFQTCYSLSEIRNTSRLTSIDARAFESCWSLCGISADNLTSIGTSAFNHCSGLSYAYFSILASVVTLAFDGCHALADVSMPSVTYVAPYAFRSCYALSTISLPSAGTISTQAFQNCSALESVSLPCVVSIGVQAFWSCWALKGISFSTAVNISGSAFACCSSLSYAYLSTITSQLGAAAFSDCAMLSDVSVPELTHVNSSTFTRCYGLSRLVLPAVANIYTQAFTNCTNLLSLYILASTVCTLFATNAFTSTPISNYTTSTGGVYGSIFVPSALLDTYKNATNWKTFSARMVGLTDAEIAALL